MKKAKRPPKKPQLSIHHSIKTCLGYGVDEPDSDVLKDWKQRLSRVCKPCWELRYCPFGPLVEESPLLPPIRQGVVEHNEYFKRCLETGRTGGVSNVDEDEKKRLRKVLSDEQMLLARALHEIADETRIENCIKAEDPVAEFRGGPLPPIEQYRVPFDPISRKRIDLDTFPLAMQKRIKAKVAADKAKLTTAIKTGKHDQTSPLDPVRRAWFEKEVAEFDPDDYPEHIPSIFEEGACSIFGHICPVFFCAEVTTETSQERRRGRYISFKTKMRVVRRDNYTCQHCGKHLQDNEVEFDHMIPVSKGGSSEEHNIRLTCFDCNRDKSDLVMI